MDEKHQSAQEECAIQTIMYMAQTFLIHVSLHWSDRGLDDLALWSFSVNHAAGLYNRDQSCLWSHTYGTVN